MSGAAQPDLWRILIEAGPRRITVEDIDKLRATLYQIGNYTDTTHRYAETRFTLELIDCLIRANESIKAMDATSTKLINTTNDLTKSILRLTAAGLIIGSLGLIIGVIAIFHH
jgi:hypothetical protein